MNYKLTVILIIIINFFGCNNMPTGVSEIQIGNAKEEFTGYIGQNLHVKATVYFPEGIKSVVLKFFSTEMQEWRILKEYSSEINRMKKYQVDESIEIPVDLPIGKYKLSVKAISESGVTVEEIKEIKIKVDSSMPFASKIDIGINAKKDNLHLETLITAPKKIKYVKVVLQKDTFSKTYLFDKVPLVDAVQYTFHEHVELKEFDDGKYMVLLIVEDQEGRSFETKGNFTK